MMWNVFQVFLLLLLLLIEMYFLLHLSEFLLHLSLPSQASWALFTQEHFGSVLVLMLAGMGGDVEITLAFAMMQIDHDFSGIFTGYVEVAFKISFITSI